MFIEKYPYNILHYNEMFSSSITEDLKEAQMDQGHGRLISS